VAAGAAMTMIFSLAKNVRFQGPAKSRKWFVERVTGFDWRCDSRVPTGQTVAVFVEIAKQFKTPVFKVSLIPSGWFRSKPEM